jgi:hypothetical protein
VGILEEIPKELRYRIPQVEQLLALAGEDVQQANILL